MAKSKPQQKASTPVIRNKKARFQYDLLEKLEVGIELVGSEVKSLREGNASLGESYAAIRDGEAFLLGANITPYACGGYANHEPTRPRKLLLHRREIQKLGDRVQQKGLTLVPMSIYFTRRGIAKVELALACGKRHYDKRDAIKKRETQREIDRAMTRRGRE